MSDNQELSAQPAETMASFQANQERVDAIVESLEAQSYFLGEVPQNHLADPSAFLSLNSDRLIGSVNVIDQLVGEVGFGVQEEVALIQKTQKQINTWEERIELNKSVIEKNLQQIQQNLIDIGYDKKNRDYWMSRAEVVRTDYNHAEAGGQLVDWAWLIKKYGLKNGDGTVISEKVDCVEELCNGSILDLQREYEIAGQKYEISRKAKEASNIEMLKENGRLSKMNEELKRYVSRAYLEEIEPLQDGVLLYKELGIKLKALGSQETKATYGDLRSWGELFLDQFLRSNPRVKQHVVTAFRRMASIPLPASHS